MDLPLTPIPLKAMWVNSITFKAGGNNLRVAANVVGDSGPIAGASVAMQVKNSSGTWTFAGTTDSSGNVSFLIQKATSDTYTATVTSLTAAGHTWVVTKGVVSSSYEHTTPRR